MIDKYVEELLANAPSTKLYVRKRSTLLGYPFDIIDKEELPEMNCSSLNSKDATRQEAILWCAENKCDFVNGVYPPPEGWAWVYNQEKTILHLYFYSYSGTYEDINKGDVLLKVG